MPDSSDICLTTEDTEMLHDMVLTAVLGLSSLLIQSFLDQALEEQTRIDLQPSSIAQEARMVLSGYHCVKSPPRHNSYTQTCPLFHHW